MSNDRFRVFSVIRKDLWDSADWRGTVFLSQPGHDFLPGIGFVFGDYAAGCRIFADWRERYGPGDGHGVIRLSVITGTHPTEGIGITIHLSTDPDGITRQDYAEAHLAIESHIVFETRHLFRPAPIPHPPLAAFRVELPRHQNRYFLTPVPAPHPNAKSRVIKPDWDHLFQKQDILFRTFSEITSEDIDSVTIFS